MLTWLERGRHAGKATKVKVVENMQRSSSSCSRRKCPLSYLASGQPTLFEMDMASFAGLISDSKVSAEYAPL